MRDHRGWWGVGQSGEQGLPTGQSPISLPKGALQEYGGRAAHLPKFHEKLEACGFIRSFIFYIMATNVHL